MPRNVMRLMRHFVPLKLEGNNSKSKFDLWNSLTPDHSPCRDMFDIEDFWPPLSDVASGRDFDARYFIKQPSPINSIETF